jgi:RNA polymerase sigma-54 factor
MATQVNFDFVPHPAMHMRPSPMLVGFAEMLALPSMEMERSVARELEDNPALERAEDVRCRFCCGHAAACPACGAGLGDLAGRAGRAGRAGPRSSSDRLDAAAGLASEERPQDILLRDALTLLPAGDRDLVELVVGSLDAHGFLRETPADFARRAQVVPDRIHRIVAALREVGHPGMAAFDLRESLILQLESLSSESLSSESLSGEGLGEPGPAVEAGRRAATVLLAREIVAAHLTALARGRFSAIAQALGVAVDDVREARAFIQRQLTPSPAERVGTERWSRPRRMPALPDLVIVERADQPGHYAVELAEAIRCAVRVDPAWRVAAEAGSTGGDNGMVLALVRRADGFLTQLGRRWNTLRQVGNCLVERQRGFIQHGPSGMVALTRAEMALDLGLSESTVSRAVAGKFALLPTGKVLPVADFFDCSLQVRTELSTIISSEERPLSDAELAGLLRGRGYDVARRTVAKYRDRLGILPVGLR